jgi:hypothetical protein
MLKYVSKLTMDILPSVVATIIGAYIVNHYIVTKPGADAPVAAAVSSADSKKPDADVANIPAAGVRARGISLKAIFDKPAAVKPAEKPQEKSAEKSQEPSEDKPVETASIPPDSKRQPPAPREKTAIRTIPLAVQPAASVAPAAVPASPAPTVEATVTPDDHRDANDLARAAIERLRGSNGSSPRVQEAVRTPDASRPDAPRVVPAPQAPTVQASAPAIRPLPPPIMVSAPPADSFGGSGPSPTQPSSATAARIDDPRRPIPPADIPPTRPLDLNAGSADPSVREHHNVAEDMLLAAKSVFHAVLPQ